MGQTWLLIDTNFLSHRAYYSQGQLSHGDISTGVIFGILKDIVHLQEYFETDKLVFCFDLGLGLRIGDYAGYKGDRRKRETEADETTRDLIKEFREQVRRLRCDYLPAIGYRNIYAENGYEADDLIAQICKQIAPPHEAIIISADHDLYQLLRPNVHHYNPTKRKIVTYDSFVREWGLEPWKFAIVKAMAGCPTDNVPGIKGVGELTAAKYLRGELKETSAAYRKIMHARATGVIHENRRLVKLPYPGLPPFDFNELVPDEVTHKKWAAVAESLGMRSLVDVLPVAGRPKGFGLEHNGKRR